MVKRLMQIWIIRKINGKIVFKIDKLNKIQDMVKGKIIEINKLSEKTMMKMK